MLKTKLIPLIIVISVTGITIGAIGGCAPPATPVPSQVPTSTPAPAPELPEPSVISGKQGIDLSGYGKIELDADRIEVSSTYKDWGKENGLTKKEWNAFRGYLNSNEHLGDRKKRISRKRKKGLDKKRPAKTKQKELRALPYQDYLKSPHWKQIRDKIRRRDKRCKICNGKTGLNVHHRSYKHLGDYAKEIKDLILLCRDCHQLFHNNGKLK